MSKTIDTFSRISRCSWVPVLVHNGITRKWGGNCVLTCTLGVSSGINCSVCNEGRPSVRWIDLVVLLDLQRASSIGHRSPQLPETWSLDRNWLSARTLMMIWPKQIQAIARQEFKEMIQTKSLDGAPPRASTWIRIGCFACPHRSPWAWPNPINVQQGSIQRTHRSKLVRNDVRRLQWSPTSDGLWIVCVATLLICLFYMYVIRRQYEFILVFVCSRMSCVFVVCAFSSWVGVVCLWLWLRAGHDCQCGGLRDVECSLVFRNPSLSEWIFSISRIVKLRYNFGRESNWSPFYWSRGVQWVNKVLSYSERVFS